MPAPDPNSPIGDDEVLLRRVREEHVLKDAQGNVVGIQDVALKPDKNQDENGLSLFRELFHSENDVAVKFRSSGRKPSYIIRLSAAKLKALEFKIDPAPREADMSTTPPKLARPGHCLIQNFSTADRDTERGTALRRKLAEIAGTPTGPFEPPPQPATAIAAAGERGTDR